MNLFIKNKIVNQLIIFAISVFFSGNSVTIAESISIASDIGFAVGFDDNIFQSEDKLSSSFSSIKTYVDTSINYKNFNSNWITMQSEYTDYFKSNDRFYFSIGMNSRFYYLNGLLSSTFIGEYSFFKDKILPENENDNYNFGIEINYILGAYIDISLSQLWSRLSYKEPSQVYALPPADNHNMENKNSINQQNNIEKQQKNIENPNNFENQNNIEPRNYIEEYRKDNVYTSRMSTNIFLNKNLSSRIYVEYERVHSSIIAENERKYDIHLSLNHNYKPFSLNFAVDYCRIEYDEDIPVLNINSNPNQPEQERPLKIYVYTQDPVERYANQISGFGEISYQMNTAELFFQYKWINYDSWSQNTSYNNRIMQCGIYFSF